MNSEKYNANCGQAPLKRPPIILRIGRIGGWAGSDCGQATPKASHCGGQATVEYVIVTGVLLALMLIMTLFMTTFKEYGARLLELIASDYP